MKILKNGNLKDYISDFYIQTFSMLFFPDDAVFSKNGAYENFIEIYAEQTDMQINISVKICYNKREIQKDIAISISIAMPISDISGEAASDSSAKLKEGLVHETGRLFYMAAAELTGVKPPWGVHTGIRPAKFAGKVFEDSAWDKNQAVAVLAGNYLINEKKAEIALDCYINAKRVVNLLENAEKEISLYVAVPFCPTKCRYCSFVSYSTPKLLKLIPEYMRVMLRELEDIGEEINKKGLILKSIYIGGGTPTVLDVDLLSMLLEKIEQCFDLSNIIEYTVEAGRPDTITQAKLELFGRRGVDRISINPQTLNDDILRSIGRRHTSDEFFAAYDIARKSGIKNINTDCIAGLFGEEKASIIATAEKLIELNPENITVHTLCIKRSSAIKTDGISDDSASIYQPYAPEVNEALEKIYELLYKSGYLPYYMYKQKYSVGNLENTGFSKKNSECLYNIYMMDELQTIYGAGAGATTKIVYPDGRIERRINNKYPYEYINNYK